MVRAEVAVSGCGVIGLSIAWRLASAGYRVVAFDPTPGRGASYAAAGMLSPVAEAAYGEEALLSLNVRAASLWPDFASELEVASGQGVGFEQAGTLLVASNGSDAAYLRDLHAFQGALGLESRWCGATACRQLEPALAPGLAGGVLAPFDGRVDNRKLLSGLAEGCRRAGVVLVETEVSEVVVSDGKVRGLVADGEHFDAEVVVVATGHAAGTARWMGPALVAPVRAVKGQILRLRTRDGDPLVERTIHAFVEGTSVYIVPRGDGRIVVGATSEERGEDTSPTGGGVYGLLRDALRVLPALDEAELVEAIARLRPGSPDNAPIVGPSPSLAGLLLATGHYRNGILLAPLTAALVVTFLETGSMPPWAAPFAPDRFATTGSR